MHLVPIVSLAAPAARPRRPYPGWLPLFGTLLLLLGVIMPGRPLRGQSDDTGANPNGNTGDFSGEITTGGSYDPFTGNAKRGITDLVVPGTAGTYPLAFGRMANSRFPSGTPDDAYMGDGGGWRHSYQWAVWSDDSATAPLRVWNVAYPDGRVTAFRSDHQWVPASENSAGVTYLHGPAGTTDRLQTDSPNSEYPGYFILHTTDGGQVVFLGGIGQGRYRAVSIVDPYNQTTSLTYLNNSNNPYLLDRVTEPAGHFLQFYYDTYAGGGKQWVVLGKVRGYTPYNTVTADVGFTYDSYNQGVPYLNLTHVFYYSEPSANGTGVYPAGCATALYNYCGAGSRPLLKTCYDPHYGGAMAKLGYDYNTATGSAWGRVLAERRAVGNVAIASGSTSLVGGPDVNETVTTLSGADASTNYGAFPTETRGDGPTRPFKYGEGSTAGFNPTNAKSYHLTSARDFLNNLSNWTYYSYHGKFLDAAPTQRNPNYGFRNAVKDARGLITHFETEPYAGQTVKVISPDNSTRRTVYDSDTNPYYVYQTIDERGQATTFTRDGNHRVTRVDYPDGGAESFAYETVDIGHGPFQRLTSHTTRRGAVIGYFYGDGNRTALPTQVTRPHNLSNAAYDSPFLAYDNNDRLLQTSDSRPNGPVERFAYDGAGRPTRNDHVDGTFTITTYDDYGNATNVRDELGHVATTSYDDYRRPTSVQVPVNQAASTYRVTQIDYNHFSVAGSAYRHTTGNFGQTILPSGRAVDMIYYDNWWPSQRIDGFGSADQSSTFFGYDEVGHRTAVNQQVSGNTYRQTNSNYDNRGRLWKTTAPNGAVTTYGYDNAGNLVRVDLPADPVARTILYADPNDPNDPAVGINYDAMNRRRWTQDPMGQQVRSAFDTDGKLNRLTDANGYTTFQYDLLGRPRKTNYLDGTSEQWTYDEGGNRLTFQNRAGTTQTMRPYDRRNRMTGWDWNDGTTASCGFGYDGAGRMTIAENWHSHDEFTYNDVGEVTTEQQNVGYRAALTVTYERDTAGRVTGMVSPVGYHFRYGYTPREQLDTISLDGPGTLANYDYFADGLRSWRALFNGSVTRSYPYDAAGRLTEQHHAHWNGNGYDNIAFRQYGWTPTDKLSWLVHTDSCAPGTDAEDGRGHAYFYDGADQLQTAYLDSVGVAGAVDGNGNSYAVAPPDGSYYRRLGDYRYDAAGNRTYANRDNTNAIGYNPDGLNRYGGCGYDARGNMTSVPASGTFGTGTWNYAYNAQNQLRTVSGTDGQGVGHTATLYYDALGRLIARYLDGQSAYLYYDLGGNVIEERDDAPNYRYTFVHGPGSDELVCRIGSGPTLWYHQDVMGDVIAVTGDGGNVLERYAYDLYGAPRVRDAAGNYRPGNQSLYNNRILHKGRDWWGEVALYDYRARAYSPALGRFLQPDPAGFAASGSNLYAYCGNDPVNKSDPSGLETPETIKRPEYAGPTTGTFIPGDNLLHVASLKPGFGLESGGGASVIRMVETLETVSTEL